MSLIVQIYVLLMLAELTSAHTKPLENKSKFKSCIQGGASHCSQYQSRGSAFIQTSFSLCLVQREIPCPPHQFLSVEHKSQHPQMHSGCCHILAKALLFIKS